MCPVTFVSDLDPPHHRPLPPCPPSACPPQHSPSPFNRLPLVMVVTTLNSLPTLTRHYRPPDDVLRHHHPAETCQVDKHWSRGHPSMGPVAGESLRL
jgi:hypothetical protein